MSEELRVADHFPRRPKACEPQADAFFECMSQKGVQPEGGQADAGRVALRACAALMKEYDQCAAKQRPRGQFRVPEAYRVRSD